jgi:proteasome assembly chaperone (PAC2) family protein
MREGITLYGQPELTNPRLIMAWPDTGHVGLRVVDYLKNKLRAKGFARIEPYDFSVVPWVSVKEGLIEKLELMKNEFYYWQDSGGGDDLIIFRSEQPSIRTYDYVGLVLDIACQFGVKRLYTAGSFGATGIVHSEEPMVLGVVNQPDLRELAESHDVKLYPEYKGIGNVHSSFLWFAKERNIEAISLWSPMPYYVARLPFPWSNYPKCSLAILEKIAAMEKIEIDTGELAAFAGQTETEMKKIYDDLLEAAKSDFVHPAAELPTSYADDTTGVISDEDLKRMLRDVDDFFKKGKQ